MTSSSSSSHSALASSSRSYKYDVFLSFRGEDTRKTFVDHLYSALYRHLISVYKDDVTLPRGESIAPSLFEAIDESQIAIVIFSKSYADSSWCLEELAHIMKRKDEKELIVIPIFYDVEPTDVRNQKRKYGEAFAKHEAKNVTKVEIWRKALFDVSNITGWEPKNSTNGHESQFIEKVVDTVLNKLIALKSYVDVDEDLVGMKARFQDLGSLLDVGSEDVRMVGIWGIGGGGKTTLATSVYMKISQYFQSHCIVEDVREETNKYGLRKLQENVLSDLFERKVKVGSVAQGRQIMRNMLCDKRVLVLLDNVDKLDQLEALVGKHNWFGPGSRIIITTRDEHLLIAHKVDHIYRVKLLSEDESIRLFKIHAYNKKDPLEDYKTLSFDAISYASGLPLSLKVLGSFLYGRDKTQWMSSLKKLKDIPDPDVMNILKISYDGLEPYQRELFLDIACFWRWRIPYKETRDRLKAFDFHPKIGIEVLRQKALITMVRDGAFDMHDLVQKMAHDIVRGKHPKNPEKHSRVWKHEDVKEICLGNATMINDTIEAIVYKYTYDHDYSSSLCKLVPNMKKLRWLSVSGTIQDELKQPTVYEDEYDQAKYFDYGQRMLSKISVFPDDFLPKELVVLQFIGSMQKELWKDGQHLPHLKILELGNIESLFSTPDFSGLPRLQRMMLWDCPELEEIHPSLGNLTSLKKLYVSGCENLKKFPTVNHMKNIKYLTIKSCYLEDGDILCGIGELSNLKELDLSGNSISRVSFSLSQLTQLKSLNLSYCDKLLELPKLPSSLVIFKAQGCKSLIIVEDFTKDCEQLCQVSVGVTDGWSDGLLQSMLKGKANGNGCMLLRVDAIDIPKGFEGNSYRLELPENWRNDFSGFLICYVSLYKHHIAYDRIKVHIDEANSVGSQDDVASMERVSGVDTEDDVGWEYTTRVWYVPFGLLRHTAWWDQTRNAVSFTSRGEEREKVLGVRLVKKRSRRGLTETSTYSSAPYGPKMHIQHDSASALAIIITAWAE